MFKIYVPWNGGIKLSDQSQSKYSNSFPSKPIFSSASTHLQVLENKFQEEEVKIHGYLLKRFKQIDNEAGYCSASG